MVVHVVEGFDIFLVLNYYYPGVAHCDTRSLETRTSWL